MSNYPKVGDIIALSELNRKEDLVYRDFKMIGSIVHPLGHTVFVFSNKYFKYVALDHSDFEHVVGDLVDGFEVLSEPRAVILNLTKEPIISKHDFNYSLIRVNLLKNHYEIVVSNKASDKVILDLKDILSEILNEDNLFRYLKDKVFTFQIKWKNNNYEKHVIS